MCWMHSKLALSHSRAIPCQYMNGRWDIWALENRSSLCRPTTALLTGEFLTVVTPDLTNISVGVPISPKISLHISQVVETEVTSEAELRTTPKNEKVGWASLLSRNVNTLTVFVILPITLGGAVFMCLIAVNYIAKRCSVHRPQHQIQGEDNPLAACFHSTVPFLNPQLQVDFTNEPLGYVNRSSENVYHSEYHVYKEIR